ncbi:MAG: AEC family transporter [Butyricicoccus sp.]
MVFVNPVFISMVIGLILFVTQPILPSVVTGTIGYIADANTALAMIILGFYLSKVRLRDLFASARLYVVSAVRLLVVPVTVLIFLLFPFARGERADYADRSGNAGCQQHSYLRAVRSGLPAAVSCMCLSPSCPWRRCRWSCWWQSDFSLKIQI